jgi:MFS family permease
MFYLFSFLKNLQFFGALVVPFYITRLSFSYTQIFLIETIFSVSLFIFEIPTGVIADKFGKKRSLFLGSLLMGFGFFIFGLTFELWMIVASQIICALGMSMISGADRALLFEHYTKKKKTTSEITVKMARYDACGTVGMLVSFPLGSWFVGSGIIEIKEGLGFVIIISGIAILLSALIVLFIEEDKTSSSAIKESSLKKGVKGLTFIFKNKELRIISLNYALISGLTFLMFWLYQTLLLEVDIPLGWNGVVGAGFNGASMLCLLAMGFVERKWATKKVLFFTSLVPGIFYLLLFILPLSKALVLTAVFVVVIMKQFRTPILQTIMNGYIDNENRATVLSGVSMIERITISVMYPLVGMLLDFSISYTFLIVGLVTVIISITIPIKKIQER